MSDKILSMNVGGSVLNLMVTGTESGGLLLSKHDLSKMAGMIYQGTASVHKIDSFPATSNTRVLRLNVGQGGAHLTFVTENAGGYILISKEDVARIVAHFVGLVSYRVKMGVMDMPRLAA